MKIFYSKCSCKKSLAADVDKPDYESQGFSLVEVSLAILVIGIGMLAVLSMFTAGLDQNKRSIDDTKSAFFAKEVFNGLLAESERDWAAIGVNGGTTDLTAAADSAWDNPATLDAVIDNQIHTNVYHLSEDPNIADRSFRYCLNVERRDRCTKSATLCVYPGEYGSTNNPYVFFMSLFNYQLQNP